jgi:hypothetical protein
VPGTHLPKEAACHCPFTGEKAEMIERSGNPRTYTWLAVSVDRAARGPGSKAEFLDQRQPPV